MKYRDHRGSLSEAMETQIEVFSTDDIKDHLNKIYEPFGKHVEDIKFEHIGFDRRTGWNTYYVLQRFKDENEFIVSGMSDGCF